MRKLIWTLVLAAGFAVGATLIALKVDDMLNPSCEVQEYGRVNFVREDGSRYATDYKSLKCNIEELEEKAPYTYEVIR
jgi:hypothetical protein